MNTDMENTDGEQMSNFLRDRKQVKNKKLQPSTVMFVPDTRRGTLVKKMKRNEERLTEMTRFKVNYVEAAGTKLGRVFSQDLSKNQPCGRSMEKCRSCNSPETKRVSSHHEENERTEQPRNGIYIVESS